MENLKRGCASDVNRNVQVGVAAYTIVEGMGGVGYALIHARIGVMSARERIVVLGEIVKRGGNNVQGCQHRDKFSCTMYSHVIHMSLT
jgi:hypothetical protein